MPTRCRDASIYIVEKTIQEGGFGRLLREWRTRRGLSQLDLAVEAGVSSRHLSFVETGRASPSREMVVLLARALDVPFRDRKAFLTAGGFAAIERAPRLRSAAPVHVRPLARHTP